MLRRAHWQRTLRLFTTIAAGMLLSMPLAAQSPAKNPGDIAGELAKPAAAPAAATGVAAAPVPGTPAPGGPVRNIYVVILSDRIDTNGSTRQLGPGFRNTAVEIRDLFARSFFTDGRWNLVLLPVGIDDQMTDSSVVTALSQIGVLTKDDILVCTTACHGGVAAPSPYVTSQGQDINVSPEYFFGHILFTSRQGEWFYRWNLWAALKSKNAGLTVLLTDSCFNFPAGIAVPQAAMSASTDPGYGEALRSLLLNYKGDVNLTASQPGTFAFYSGSSVSDYRGIFSMAFVGAARSSVAMTWPQLYDVVRQATDEGYQDVRRAGGQPRQLPYSFTDLNTSVK